MEQSGTRSSDNGVSVFIPCKITVILFQDIIPVHGRLPEVYWKIGLIFARQIV
jgi:hypothetical protein